MLGSTFQIVMLHVVHIFVFGVFLLHVGVTKPQERWMYTVLSILGLLAFLSFGVRWKQKDPFWVVWHMLVIGCILMWVGVQSKQSYSFMYKLLIILGSAAIGYHSIRLIQKLEL